MWSSAHKNKAGESLTVGSFASVVPASDSATGVNLYLNFADSSVCFLL